MLFSNFIFMMSVLFTRYYSCHPGQDWAEEHCLRKQILKIFFVLSLNTMKQGEYKADLLKIYMRFIANFEKELCKFGVYLKFLHA